MKKPMHWFACVVWLAAALYPVTETFRLATIKQSSEMAYWFAARSVVIVFVELAALAILIEIADQIRWRGLTPEEQSQALGPSALDRRLTG